MKSDTDFFESLKFQFPFRRYQAIALNIFSEISAKQKKFHIVAPPGSGKTILGLEIINRFGRPAVIFSPTTTIQEQWKDKLKMFLPKGSKINLIAISSSDSKNIKIINTLTYQSLSSQTENKNFLVEAGITYWIKDLTKRKTEEEARERIELMKKTNPRAYSLEISKYSKKAKDDMLSNPEFDVKSVLHSNAKKLIDDLVEKKVGVIILDECHHLLDYWAIVLKQLIRELPDVFVVGLTATPPVLAEDDELDNYLSIVGEIDFEIPTPAVVKNGNLAPYQDLVYFVEPTDPEKKFLREQRKIFLSLMKSISENKEFIDYIHNKTVNRTDKEGNKISWDAYLSDHYFFSIASVKYLNLCGASLPNDIYIPQTETEELTIDEWLVILEDFCLNHLKLSDEKEDIQALKDIKAVLKNLGVVLSETGFRSYISPIERIISFSDAKLIGLTDILRVEYEHMGDRLSAVVITDFEKSSSRALKTIEGILDPEAGGAVRVLRFLVSDKTTNKLDPVMVTGKSVLVDTDFSEEFISRSKVWFEKNKLEIQLQIKKTNDPLISEIKGEGSDWRPRNYVRYVTWLFDQNITKCIIGTRGLLGEGWDSLTLNTLIDLTSAGTYATVNQIRGRSLRLDPSWPKKVANNWDIVCIAPEIPKSGGDFRRLKRKHSHFFGINEKGEIVRGIQHLDKNLPATLFIKGFAWMQYSLINRRSIHKAGRRNEAYELWGVGKSYTNFVERTTELRKEDVKLKTAYTFKRSLKRLLYLMVANFVAYFYVIFYLGAHADIFLAALIAVFMASLASIKYTWIYFKKSFVDLPVDSYLLDFGRAVLGGLNSCNFLENKCSPDNLRVVLTPDNYYRVHLDYASSNDTKTFSNTYKELMDPIVNQRYLISREEYSLDMNFFSPLWYTFFELTRILRRNKKFFHPVPSIFGQKKEYVEKFTSYWKKYVGGGNIVYTRSPEGRKILLQHRIENRLEIGINQTEIWR
ncbi:MAG: DEAD/DEAH box helicase family protein [Candidatus Altiarchaeota archaeon]